MKVVVARLEDFPCDTRRIVRVAGREIGVFRVEDRFYAVRNRCPHQGGPLCAGRVFPRIVSDAPGEIRLEPSRPPFVVCPWHGWQYDMATGHSYAPGDPHVKSYRVSVEPGSRVGPYVAETFPVYVEEEYVVLDA